MTKNLFITGYNGTQRIAIGRLVAKQLSRPFVDLDLLVEQRSGKKMEQMIETEGNWNFRLAENIALTLTASNKDQVISLSEGSLLSETGHRENNLIIVKGTGDLVVLTEDLEIVLNRIHESMSELDWEKVMKQSPLELFKAKLKDRDQFYHKIADCLVDTSNLSIDEVVKRILEFSKQTVS